MSERTAILSSLVYVFHRDECLLIHRDTRGAAVDFHSCKWNGLGGRATADESILDCAVRELREESGFDFSRDRLAFLGFIQFPLFKPAKREDWNVGVFVAEATDRERARPLAPCEEGTLHWIRTAEMDGLPFWPGDVHFLPFVKRREPFYGVIRYDEGAVASAEIRPIAAPRKI